MGSSSGPFYKPIFIVSAPRSGSTMLFELLTKAKSLWSIGDESHIAIESIPVLRPFNNSHMSNALDSGDATPDVVYALISNFTHQLINNKGEAYTNKIGRVRLLEKTPKNALRISFLEAVFPDALFIYLYREPKANISSIIEAWRSGRFVTYRQLPGTNKTWSLLLPQGWRDYIDKELEVIAAYQWVMANTSIQEHLERLPSNRWIAVSYDDLIKNPKEAVKTILGFSRVPFDIELQEYLKAPLPLSRYTFEKPSSDKWKKNEAEILRVLSKTERCQNKAEVLLQESKSRKFTPISTNEFNKELEGTTHSAGKKMSRNEPCYCGSGKKYKHCHG